VCGALEEKGRRRGEGEEAPRCGGAAWRGQGRMGRREVGEAPDRRAPPVSRRVREVEVEWVGLDYWAGS
jgi:hypothetical protein